MTAAADGVVYVDEPVHPDAVVLLRRRGPVALGHGPQATPFDAVAPRVEGILVRTGAISAGMIAGAPRLRVIARHGVGLDAIDVAAATRHGVTVLITPEANAASVAEHTIGLLLAASRRVIEGDRAVRGGEFAVRDRLVGTELAGKTLAVLGLGRVGRRVAGVAAALGMAVRGHDPGPVDEAELPAQLHRSASLTELLSGAHALSVHVPLGPDTRGIIAGPQLDLLAEGATVVNTARGGVVDEAALAARLADRRLGGAGVDVFDGEPDPHTPLIDTPAAVLTPHTAAHTHDALRRMSVHAAAGIATVLDGHEPDATAVPVNAAIPSRP